MLETSSQVRLRTLKYFEKTYNEIDHSAQNLPMSYPLKKKVSCQMFMKMGGPYFLTKDKSTYKYICVASFRKENPVMSGYL